MRIALCGVFSALFRTPFTICGPAMSEPRFGSKTLPFMIATPLPWFPKTAVGWLVRVKAPEVHTCSDNGDDAGT
jgi:hypothetical protein